MKWIFLATSALAGAWFYHYGDTPWIAYGGPAVFSLFGVYTFATGAASTASRQIVPVSAKKPHTLVLKGLTWDRNEFCRGWLIRGKTGCGKTKSGILNIMFQVFTNEPGWGGVCIDEKGLFWETLCAMARHFGREQDLLLLQVRPEGTSGDWNPPPASTCSRMPASRTRPMPRPSWTRPPHSARRPATRSSRSRPRPTSARRWNYWMRPASP